jgi:peroxiredoxin
MDDLNSQNSNVPEFEFRICCTMNRIRNLAHKMSIQYIRYLCFGIFLCLNSCNYHQHKPSSQENSGVKVFDQLPIPVEIKNDIKGAPVSAFIFLSAGCPICSRCAINLQQFYASVKGKGVKIYAVFPNRERRSAIRNFRKYYGLQFPLYSDKGKVLTKHFNVKVTPQAIVINNSGQVLYSGAMDNSAVARADQKGNASKSYFADAINAYLNGAIIKVEKTDPMGCRVEERR